VIGQSFFYKIKNGGYLSIAIPVMAVEWILFKICYPYADYFTDSYSYIDTAARGDAVGYRPLGYSLFLRLVHAVSASDTVLVTLQYALVQGACLGLLVMLVKRYALPLTAARILLAGILLNPTIPYLCNYVSSDALFLGLSLIWLMVLMGLLRVPSWGRLWLQLVLLFVIFNLRFVALFYPAVAALCFLLLRRKGTVGYKLTGVLCSIAVVVACSNWIKQVTYRETGAATFSAFSGWQIANNVMNMYPFIYAGTAGGLADAVGGQVDTVGGQADTAGLPTAESRELARDIGAFFAKTGPALRARGAVSTTEYMWLHSSPLHQFMDSLRQRQKTDYFRAWNRVGPIFSQYSFYVIRRHPLAYIRYYGSPSAGSFFLAPLDVFAVYNEGNVTIDRVACNWFRYKTNRPRVWSATAQARLLAPMPWVALLLYVLFPVTALLFLLSGRCRGKNPLFTGALELVAAYLLANTIFSIFASPSVFRYQLLPMILLFVFSVCCMGILLDRRDGQPHEMS
jgi:hypothetical protein